MGHEDIRRLLKKGNKQKLFELIVSLFERMDAQEKMIKTQQAIIGNQGKTIEKQEKIIAHQGKIIEEQIIVIAQQKETIDELKDRLAKDSNNSGKPPSSDGYGKTPRTKSLRKPSGKKSGGQAGHVGGTLKQTDAPDTVITHAVSVCGRCHASLESEPAVGSEKRQVFDIPPLKVEVTEHRSETKVCPHCRQVTKAPFPESVSGYAQYGGNIKALASYLNIYQFIPLDRVCELFADVFRCPLSESVVRNANAALEEQVKPANEAIRELLQAAGILHADESGIRSEGKLHWLHVASTDALTAYGIHKKRGKEAMDSMGILGHFAGRMIHDFWKPYFRYEQCEHGGCNAHTLRELDFVLERYDQQWAGEMKKLLLDIKKAREKCQEPGESAFPESVIREYEQQYDVLLKRGFLVNPPPEKKQGKRGKAKQTPPKNLLDRLKKYKTETLAFMYDFRVPFDNNQAERDVRMIKLKQKISGAFRTTAGAETFCAIRGYISTVRKNSYNVMQAIRDAYEGYPFIPEV